MLVILAVIVILAALVLPTLTKAKGQANRAVCLNNLKQINSALRMYADDSGDKSPWVGPGTNRILAFCYKELIEDYVAAKGADQSRQKLFACPSDTFYYDLRPESGEGYVPRPRHDQAMAYFSSYSFNGWNQFANLFTNAPFGALPGVAGRTLASIRHPTRTALVLEAPGLFPYSWHKPKRPLPVGHELPVFNNAKSLIGFVDGHVGYISIYWNTNMVPSADGYLISLASDYDPPAGYEYQWSAD